MRTIATALAACLLSCGPPATPVESVECVEPVDPISAPAPAPPIPPEDPEPEPASPLSAEEAVKLRIGELFDLCEDGEFDRVAGYIVYRGEDDLRKWKTVCDYSTEEGQKAAHGLCNRVNAYLQASDTFEFEDYEIEVESEGEWHVQEVVFAKGGDRKVAYFAFLMVEGVYALGDID
jgi:hypothetical protein